MASAKMEGPGGNRGSTKVSSSVSSDGRLYTSGLHEKKSSGTIAFRWHVRRRPRLRRKRAAYLPLQKD